jgi:hypothetical protein
VIFSISEIDTPDIISDPLLIYVIIIFLAAKELIKMKRITKNSFFNNSSNTELILKPSNLYWIKNGVI